MFLLIKDEAIPIYLFDCCIKSKAINKLATRQKDDTDRQKTNFAISHEINWSNNKVEHIV